LLNPREKFLLLQAAVQKLLGFGYNYYETEIEENQIAKVSVLTGAFMLMRITFLENWVVLMKIFLCMGEILI
jgi:hypothetical protein